MFAVDSTERNNGQHYQRLVLIRPYLGRLLLGFIVMVFTVMVQLAYPKAVAFFIDNSVTEKSTEWLTWVALIMIVVFLIQAAATGLRFYIFESTGHMIVTKIRRMLYGAIIQQEIGFFDVRNVGELTNRLSSDVEVLESTLSMGMAIALRSLFTCIGCVVMLIMLSPELSILVLAIVPLAFFSSQWIGKKIEGKSKGIQENLAYCGKVAQESFSNIRLVHAFTQEEKEKGKYRQATENALAYSMGTTRLFAIFQAFGSFIEYLALIITLWFGGKLVVDGSLSIGELTSFILYAGMAASSAGGLSMFWGEWMQSLGATERVFELLERIPNIVSNEKSDKKYLTGKIEIEDVIFAYPGRAEHIALEKLNLNISAGEKIALVGHSGAGKSTIANLILGFYHPTKGQLKFDGVNAAELNLKDIRRNIGIVEQEPSLFSGTIRENLQYAVVDRVVSDSEIINAAKHANAHDFIAGFPDGYDTQLGERGVQLSGGQKQRIAIARALLRDPAILILDEATSALDSESERQVQLALQYLMKGRTTIMIAHRMSTIVHADRIIVMEMGKIIQQGAHQQLIKNHEGLYYQLMKNQLLDSKGRELKLMESKLALSHP